VPNISVVINAQNVEADLPRALASVKSLADEIVVIDQGSTDKTSDIAKKAGAKVFSHESVDYVEKARNFAISKANGDWILVLDPDEEISDFLARKIKDVIKNNKADYYRISRKNIVFGKWLKHSRWWPDYNIRLFRKGKVSWNEVIHAVPMTQGVGGEIKDKEELAIIHHHYANIDQYLERMIRYSRVQSEELIKNKYEFNWTDLVTKPVNEFLSRYFAGKGYKDGLHGLTLSILQAFSEFIVYVRVWGKNKYSEKEIGKNEIKNVFGKQIHDINWWIRKEFSWLRLPKFW
jgi:(heptosyl)LPS beta-1,4-glucosyltransferase